MWVFSDMRYQTLPERSLIPMLSLFRLHDWAMCEFRNSKVDTIWLFGTGQNMLVSDQVLFLYYVCMDVHSRLNIVLFDLLILQEPTAGATDLV